MVGSTEEEICGSSGVGLGLGCLLRGVWRVGPFRSARFIRFSLE